MARLVTIGDFHIPTRAREIPRWIRERLEKERIDWILCTGDLESLNVLDYLKSMAPTKCVAGNMDSLPLPDQETLDLGDFRIGLIHGKGIHPRGDLATLNWIAREMGADILVHGHTHKLSVDLYEGRLFVNPGTATGAWGGATDGEPETFIIIEIEGDQIGIRKFMDGKEEVEVYAREGRVFKRVD